ISGPYLISLLTLYIPPNGLILYLCECEIFVYSHNYCPIQSTVSPKLKLQFIVCIYVLVLENILYCVFCTYNSWFGCFSNSPEYPVVLCVIIHADNKLQI